MRGALPAAWRHVRELAAPATRAVRRPAGECRRGAVTGPTPPRPAVALRPRMASRSSGSCESGSVQRSSRHRRCVHARRRPPLCRSTGYDRRGRQVEHVPQPSVQRSDARAREAGDTTTALRAPVGALRPPRRSNRPGRRLLPPHDGSVSGMTDRPSARRPVPPGHPSAERTFHVERWPGIGAATFHVKPSLSKRSRVLDPAGAGRAPWAGV